MEQKGKKIRMKYKGYKINEPREAAKLYICNCVYGHYNCKCDGNGNKRKD